MEKEYILCFNCNNYSEMIIEKCEVCGSFMCNNCGACKPNCERYLTVVKIMDIVNSKHSNNEKRNLITHILWDLSLMIQNKEIKK